MNIYISGISGTGMGPLALMAKAAGLNVSGSDLSRGAVYDELVKAGIDVYIGEQDGVFFQKKLSEDLDWFVYTSALPEDHPELVAAKRAGLKCTKRDDLTAFLVEKLNLKMIAVAGTHGKTTTTSMIVWAALKLGLPASYLVGTTLGFAPAGAYHQGDKYFIYEADEYDRNFLKFHPWLAVIPAISYDHPDIYPTVEDYEKAFFQFEAQSKNIIEDCDELSVKPEFFDLAGQARRVDAALAANAILKVQLQEAEDEGTTFDDSSFGIVDILNEFPGVGRRFERLADGVYTDYAHHPDEIAATMDVAQDEVNLREKKGVVVVYQPHQNTRQHEVADGYYDAFVGAEKIFWLPTYLTRENPDLPVLTSHDLIEKLANADVAEPAEMNDELFDVLMKYRDDGYLVLLMTAGPADGWLREKLAKS